MDYHLRIAGQTFRANDQLGTDLTPELEAFATFFGLERLIPGRYSALFLLALFGGFKSERLNPYKVMCEIEILEGNGKKSALKGSTRFRRAPLRGLWHKHYLPDGMLALAINAQEALKKFRLPYFENLIKEAEKADELRYASAEDMHAISIDAVQGNLTRRREATGLTGNWIIYAVHGGSNYYLCLGEHGGDENQLRAQIDDVCCTEFPFLNKILK